MGKNILDEKTIKSTSPQSPTHQGGDLTRMCMLSRPRVCQLTFRVRIYSQCRIEEQSSKQGRKVTKERTGVKRRLWLSGYARIHGSSQFNAHKLMEA